MDKVNQQIKSIISEVTKIPVESIDDSNEFIRDLNLNSLKMVELIGIIEEDFNILISESDFIKIQNVAGLCQYISQKKIV